MGASSGVSAWAFMSGRPTVSSGLAGFEAALAPGSVWPQTRGFLPAVGRSAGRGHATASLQGCLCASRERVEAVWTSRIRGRAGLQQLAGLTRISIDAHPTFVQVDEVGKKWGPLRGGPHP